MKIIGNVFKVVLVAVLIVCSVTIILVTKQQNYSGSYSSATVCSKRVSEYMVENFGSADDVEQLLSMVNDFAVKNFTYVKKGFYFQYFDADEFIFEDKLHGLCWDFACFTKIAVLTVSEHKGWDDVEALVCDVYIPKQKVGHSFNFVSDGEKTYYIDNTYDNTRYKNGKMPYGAVNIGDYTKKGFVKALEMEFKNYH